MQGFEYEKKNSSLHVNLWDDDDLNELVDVQVY